MFKKTSNIIETLKCVGIEIYYGTVDSQIYQFILFHGRKININKPDKEGKVCQWTETMYLNLLKILNMEGDIIYNIKDGRSVPDFMWDNREEFDQFYFTGNLEIIEGIPYWRAE